MTASVRSTLDPVLAFDLREDERDARRLAHLRTAGHTHARCSRCGDMRRLAWVREECPNPDETTDDGMCGGVYRAEGAINPGDELTVTRTKAGLC